MIQQENKTGKWIAMAVSIPLAAFTIWRAWDLMTAILPADQSIAAIFGIAALDGGMVAWVYGYMGAKGSDQRRVAGIFATLDFLGVGVATVLDLTMTAWKKGLVEAPTNLYMAAIILVSAAVVLNVGAGWLYVINDPKKKQEIRDQQAHDKINDLADAQIEQHAAMYAPQFAQAKVELWLYQARMIHNIPQLQQPQSFQQLPSAQPQQPLVMPVQQPQQEQKQSIFAKIGQGISNFVNADSPPVFPTPQPPQSNVMSSSEQSSTPAQPDYDWLARQQLRMEREAEQEKARIAEARARILAEEQAETSSPLQSPQVETGSQAGMNGHKN